MEFAGKLVEEESTREAIAKHEKLTTNSRLSVRESHRQVIFNNDFACGGKRRDYKEKRRRRTFIDLKGNLSEIINCIQNRVIIFAVNGSFFAYCRCTTAICKIN